MGEDVPDVINVPLHAFLIEIAVNAPTVAEMVDHIPVNAAEFPGKALFCPLIKTDRLLQEIPLARELRNAALHEFSIEKQEFFEIQPVRHLTEEIRRPEHLSDDGHFFGRKIHFGDLCSQSRAMENVGKVFHLPCTVGGIVLEILPEKGDAPFYMGQCMLSPCSFMIVALLDVTRIVHQGGDHPDTDLPAGKHQTRKECAVHEPGHGQHDRARMTEIMVFGVTGPVAGIDAVKKSPGICEDLYKPTFLKIRIHQGDEIKDFFERRL